MQRGRPRALCGSVISGASCSAVWLTVSSTVIFLVVEHWLLQQADQAHAICVIEVNDGHRGIRAANDEPPRVRRERQQVRRRVHARLHRAAPHRVHHIRVLLLLFHP